MSYYQINSSHLNPCNFSFSFSSRWHNSARKGPYALRPVSQQSPQGCPRNSANICLVQHRSFSTMEGGMSAASFLHSSFLQAVSAVMLWLHIHAKHGTTLGKAESSTTATREQDPKLDSNTTSTMEAAK